MKTATTTSKVTTFDFGAASEHANTLISQATALALSDGCICTTSGTYAAPSKGWYQKNLTVLLA